MNTYLRKIVQRTMRQIAKEKGPRYDESTIGRRGRIAAQIAQCAEGGTVAMEVWQMDCDCASWTQVRMLPAHAMIVDRYCDQIYMDAEGPVRIRMLKPSECDPDDLPPPRDHAMEAFENGNQYAVTY